MAMAGSEHSPLSLHREAMIHRVPHSTLGARTSRARKAELRVGGIHEGIAVRQLDVAGAVEDKEAFIGKAEGRQGPKAATEQPP
eukprot:13004664-Heterocapsa_arctica.AAC.1